ncbi:ribosome silencing factor [Planktothrix sp. FACHB-1355]|uniref:Ribosomal silencing factor RsfS n=1 Tax=Aerosakkonema funiforme FACHB-1375 TaxID=2949571 RepID=A0A926VE77_9CYAN|nr:MULTISPECIES: ribosome silencing factor [Oscillatoriales]MBD2182134.1 ribosome silencing factor [Aerosakkonema funiforme FACHB-1375]MBD3562935.1 ribosome silencing factor [Planktothrix sp. FACHB-1355]
MSDHIKSIESAYPTVLTDGSAANSIGNRQDTSSALALNIAEAASDRKGGDIVVLRVSEVSYLADYFIIVTGFSRVQVRAISQSIQEKVEQELQRRPRRIEGLAEGTWVVLDYGDAIAHILMPREREFYNLEAFWGHAERIELPQIETS